MLLFVYTSTHKGFVIFSFRYFKLSWNTTALSRSNCRNFSCSSIHAQTILNKKKWGDRNCCAVSLLQFVSKRLVSTKQLCIKTTGFIDCLHSVCGTCTILSNHLLQLLYSVPSPCRDWRAVTEQVGFSITLGDWVEWGGGWSRHRTKTAFSIASRLALFLRSVIRKQKDNHCLAQ